MEDIIRLYNNIMDLETDMLLNPDNYTEEQKEKYYKTIKETEAILYENGFVIDTDGVLKKLLNRRRVLCTATFYFLNHLNR